MESRLLGPKTSSSTRRIGLAILGHFSESLTLIPFTHLYAMFFFSQLDRWDGTPQFPIRRWKIRPMIIMAGHVSAWNNIFAIASTFALLMSSPIISFSLASSFMPMSVRLGRLLSRGVLVILLARRL